jgi:competence protein ComEA
MHMIKIVLAAILSLFAAMAFAAVDVNKATQAELEGIKGIGPAISAKIIEERKKGAFKDWQDMVVRVKGVGEGNAAKFSTEGLTVNGSAFAGAPVKPATAAAAKKTEKKTAPAATTPTATPAPAAKADDKPAAASAAEKKAAAQKAKDDKKAARAAAADAAKKEKAEKAAAKKAAKGSKPATAAASAATK